MLELIVGWLFWMIKHANKWLFTSNCHFNATFRPCNVCLTKLVMGEMLYRSDNWKWRVICWRAWSSKIVILLQPLHLPSLQNCTVNGVWSEWSAAKSGHIFHFSFITIFANLLITTHHTPPAVSICTSVIPLLNYIHLLNFCFGSYIDAVLIACASMAPLLCLLAWGPLTSVM